MISVKPGPAWHRCHGAPATTAPPPQSVDPHHGLGTDALLSDEERMLRDTVRQFVGDRILPEVGDWFDQGIFPKDMAKEFGALGLLGMHLGGYGCAGTSATAYGLACLELEAGDSGARSFVSVQGSLAMFPIHAFGSEEQKQAWLPGMAAGELIGCFGLTEPDSGSDPSSMRTTARRDASGDWVLNGAKRWFTNGSGADVAVVVIRRSRPCAGGDAAELERDVDLPLPHLAARPRAGAERLDPDREMPEHGSVSHARQPTVSADESDKATV